MRKETNNFAMQPLRKEAENTVKYSNGSIHHYTNGKLVSVISAAVNNVCENKVYSLENFRCLINKKS